MPQKLDIEIIPSFGVASTAEVETPVIDVLRWPRIESVWVRAVSVTGAPDVKVEWAGGIDESNFEAFENNLSIIESTGGLTDPEGWHKFEMANHLSAWVKFRVTGNGSNPSDTIVSMRVLKREDYE